MLLQRLRELLRDRQLPINAPTSGNLIDTAAPGRKPKADALEEDLKNRDLHDDRVDASIGSEYSYFLNTNFFNTINDAYAAIIRALSCDQITAGAAGGFSSLEISAQRSSAYRIWKQEKLLSNVFKKDSRSQTITAEVPLPPIKFQPAGFASRSDEDKKIANDILKALLGWSMPSKAVDGQVAVGAEKTVNLNQIADLPPFSDPDISLDSEVKAFTPSDANFKKYANAVSFTLKCTSLRPVYGAASGIPSEGEASIGDVRLHGEVEVTLKVTFPMIYAYWATSAANDAEFSIVEFAKHFNNHLDYQIQDAKKKKKSRPPAQRRASVLSFIRRTGKVFSALEGVAKPRMSDDRLTILGDGRLIWIPEITGGLKAYQDAEKSRYNEETGVLDMLPHDSPVRDSIILVDWRTNVLVYVNREGNLETISLVGARPLDDTTIGFLLTKSPSVDEVMHLASIVDRYGKKIGIGMLESPVTGFQVSAKDAMKEVIIKVKSLSWIDLIDGNAVDDRGQELPRYSRTLRQFSQSVMDCYSRMDELDMPLSVKIMDFPMMKLFGEYAQPANRKRYTDLARESLQNNTKEVVIPDTPELVGMPGVSHMMPHQVAVGAIIDSQPSNMILGVDGGGGKTLLQIKDIITGIDSGKYSRPLLLMPGAILKQFAGQIHTFTKGRLRVFMLDNITWGSWRRAGLTKKDVADLIKAQSPNTVFMMSYDFAKKFSKNIAIGDNEVRVYPIVQWLISLGIDAIFADESHKAKNIGSQVSEVVRTFGSISKATRLSSGTIISNTPSDLAGQVSSFNPAALGSDLDRYIDEKTRRIRTEAIPEIQRAVRTFSRYVSVKNSEWSFLLPEIKPLTHVVRLTGAQKGFYDKILNGLLEEIKNDKKLSSLLKSGDPNDEEKIVSALKRYFARLEIFLSAPDAPPPTGYGPAFTNLENVTQNDLVSPKVQKIDEILHAHFNGGQVSSVGPDGNEILLDYPKSANKVLIVAYNRAIGDHIVAHSRFSGMMVRYKAGYEEIITQFQEDPAAKVMVADANTMKEGINLQVADRMILVQSFWTVGDYEQLLWRIVRPDVPDASGNQKYNRPFVYLDEIIVDHTIDIPKKGRLMWKQIEKSRIEDGDTPSFRDWLRANAAMIESTGRLSMNLNVVEQYSTVDSLSQHFTLYDRYLKWKSAEFYQSRQRVKQSIERRMGTKIDDSEIVKYALVPVKHKDWNKGDNHGIFGPYSANPPGVVPYDPYGLDLIVAAEADSSDDEDDGENTDGDEEIAPLNKGDVVITNYGLGVVESVRQGKAMVLIPGFRPHSVSIRKTQIWIPSKEVDRKALTRIFIAAGGKGLSSVGAKGPWLTKDQLDKARKAVLSKQPLPKGSKDSIKETIKESMDEDTRIAPKEEKISRAPSKPGKQEKVSKISTSPVEYVALYNKPGIFLFEDHLTKEQQQELLQRGWFEIGPSVQASVFTAQGMADLIKYLKKNFVIQPRYLRQMEAAYTLFKAGKDSVTKLRQQDPQAMMKLIQDRKPVQDKQNEIKPIVLVEDDDLVVLIDGRVCPAARKLVNRRPVPGTVSKFEKNDGLFVYLGKTRKGVAKEMEALNQSGMFRLTGTRRVMKNLDLA